MSARRVQAHLFFVVASLLFVSSGYAKKWPVYAKKGMVVSTERLASEIGMEVLRKGGNAIDAAVATGFALAVIHPAAGNIGGGGFMLIRFAQGRAVVVDYREKAPMAAHERMFLDEGGTLIKDSNHDSYLAVGVPGTVAGLTLALEKYGTMKLEELMKPAIRLAGEGFPVSYAFHQDLERYAEEFREYPASARKFLKDDGQPYQHGELWQQKDLERTLTRIADAGKDGFYKGKTAELIAADMKANGGLITEADLAAYEAVIREPIEFGYREYTVTSVPPPSSGGVTLALMLNILEGYNLVELGHNTAAYIHVLSEAMRRAFSQRARYLGDPDFNPNMPIAKLISDAYAEELRKSIDFDRASVSEAGNFDWSLEPSETTHFSVVDAFGNAVANMYTIEQWYGSRIVADGAGFLYNNEMGDFNPWPGHTDSTGLIGTEANLAQPGKRMLSSMTPTIVSRNDSTLMVTGSPGGRTIINTVLQTILNVVDFEMNIFDAVNAPRFHHQWLPDRIYIEEWGTTKDSVEKLEAMGHKVRSGGTMGRAMSIYIDPETGYKLGAADPRSPNRAAVGY